MKRAIYRKKIMEGTLNQVKEKLMNMERFEHESENMLYYLSTLPKEDSKASFEIVARTGKLEAFNINDMPELTIDIIKMNKGTTTESTAVDRPILFKPIIGNCVLEYADKKGVKEKYLSRSQLHEIKPETQFTIKTNGMDCELVLLLSGS